MVELTCSRTVYAASAAAWVSGARSSDRAGYSLCHQGTTEAQPCRHNCQQDLCHSGQRYVMYASCVWCGFLHSPWKLNEGGMRVFVSALDTSCGPVHSAQQAMTWSKPACRLPRALSGWQHCAVLIFTCTECSSSSHRLPPEPQPVRLLHVCVWRHASALHGFVGTSRPKVLP